MDIICNTVLALLIVNILMIYLALQNPEPQKKSQQLDGHIIILFCFFFFFCLFILLVTFCFCIVKSFIIFARLPQSYVFWSFKKNPFNDLTIIMKFLLYGYYSIKH